MSQNFKISFCLILVCVSVALAALEQHTLDGEWTDERFGFSLYICIKNRRLHGAYSESGLIQALLVDDQLATGRFYESRANERACSYGDVIVQVLNQDNIYLQFTCNDTKVSTQYYSKRITSVRPQVHQCALLDVSGLFTMNGYFVSYDSIYRTYEPCLDKSTMSYTASYAYPVDDVNPTADKGFEKGIVLVRGNENPDNSSLSQHEFILSGTSYEPNGYRATSLMFRLEDARMGVMWWSDPDPTQPLNMTGGLEDYFNHGYNLFSMVYGVPDYNCRKNAYVLEEETSYQPLKDWYNVYTTADEESNLSGYDGVFDYGHRDSFSKVLDQGSSGASSIFRMESYCGISILFLSVFLSWLVI